MRHRNLSNRRLHVLSSLVPALLAASCAGVGPAREGNPDLTAAKRASEARPISDPYEPVNRVMWSMNRGVTLGVLEPLTTIYTFAIPEPVRDSIGNVRDNLGGPLRMTNQALQGRWDDSGEETLRFLTNSTLGVGGLFDVASHMNLPGSPAAFNQTFRHWGWQPDTYLVLPLLGPSDNVALPARAMDIAADPANYVSALRPIAYGTRMHQVSEITHTAAAPMRTEADSYSLVQQVWPYLSRTAPPDWTVRGAPDMPTLESLNAARYGPTDPLFLSRGNKHWVRLPGTGRDFPYHVWMQKRPATLVYLNPGIGSHRTSGNTLALAEMLHRMGYSVVTMSGIFHPEFMERASTAVMPGNPLWDRSDVLAVCTAIDGQLRRKYRHEPAGRVLAGFSLGGFAALQLAATEESHAPGSVRFDHYLAIQSPVDLREAYRTLDGYFGVPATWPAGEAVARLDNMFHKATASITGRPPAGVIPFDGDESRTLVGYGFRVILRDALYSVHARTPSDRVRANGTNLRRSEVYQELMGISFDEYFQNWLSPEARRQGVSEKLLLERITLRNMERSLRDNPRIHVIGNRNDYLLSQADVDWVSTTFDRRATWLPGGGHLGNLGDPKFIEALEGVCRSMK